jgi:uncharacterized protein
MSSAAYPGSHAVASVAGRLALAARRPHHEFWSDHVSLLDPDAVDATRIHGAKQITDAYLLALAVARGGCLVSFDKRIALSAVAGANPSHLVVL